MSESAVAVDTSAPSYVGWRSVLLAELALARVPEFLAHPKPNGARWVPDYDFLVTTQAGPPFLVLAKGFSPYHLRLKDVASRAEWRLDVPADLVRQARASGMPVMLFLFDADKDPGRYLRLDTLPEPKNPTVTLRLPVDQPLTAEGLRGLLHELRDDPERPVTPSRTGPVRSA